MGEEKLGARSFPAGMDPEPVGRGDADFLFEGEIDLGGEAVGIGRIARERIGDNDPPAGEPGGVNGDGDEGSACSHGHGGGEGRGRGQPAKERGPDAAVARMLIDQDAGHIPLAQELDGLAKTAPAIEGDEAEPGAGGGDMAVEIRIPEGLIDGADEAARGPIGDDVGQEFPIAEMGEDENDAFAGLGGLVEGRHVLDLDAGGDGLLAHCGELEGGEEIGAKSREVFTGQTAEFGGGFFALESDEQVPQDEPAVGRGQMVSAPAEGAAEEEAGGKREQGNAAGERAVEEVEEEIHLQYMRCNGCSSSRLAAMPPRRRPL